MILEQIVADKRQELEESRRLLPLAQLKKNVAKGPPARDFASSLQGEGVKLIAEVKKASPSKGLLCPDFNPLALARAYIAGGAAAISVLTEARYFQGDLNHLISIRKTLNGGSKSVPLLRKDFLFHPYQIYESRAFGADAVLLIVAILTDEGLRELLDLSRRLGMEGLVEVHNEEEIGRALAAEAKIIGINNRDLHTFDTVLGVTQRLRSLIPPQCLVVSESGIKGREDIQKLKEWGVNAVLIGEALVTAPDVAVKIQDFL